MVSGKVIRHGWINPGLAFLIHDTWQNNGDGFLIEALA
jgi:hypothetical protein